MTLNFLKSKRIFYLSLAGTVAGASCLLKDYMQGARFKNPIKSEGKVCIVTGCNTGIGKETVRELAKRGAHVYMACRDMEKCEEARKEIVLESRNKYLYCRKCDLASFKSIHEFVNNFKAEQNRLDILINNAGVMGCPRSLTEDGIELQLGVNHMGHFLLTYLLLDVLKSSAPSRIVNVSSAAHYRGKIDITDLNSERTYGDRKAYEQSKLANILFTRELAKRLQGTGVTVNTLHPGVVSTDLFRHIGILNTPILGHIAKGLLWPFVKNPISGSQTTLYVALEPELEKITGEYFSDCAIKEPSTEAQNEHLAKWLWAVSEKWTKIENLSNYKPEMATQKSKT